MGMLSSFLCCGTADAKDDSDDKYHKQTSRRGASGPAKMDQRGTAKDSGKDASKNTGQDASKDVKAQIEVSTKAANSKSALDDDPSVQEGDRNTNTHKSTDHKPGASSELEDASVDVVTEHVKVEDGQAVPDGAGEVPLPSGDQGDAHNDVNPGEAGELTDLSKMQDGQSFNPETGFLLGRKDTKRFGAKKCLILDLDETLVHSSFKYLRTADFMIPVEIDDQVHHVYVIKRPGVDEFLRKVGQWFEVVVFTASVAKYGHPLLNKLDIHKSVHYRLFRDSCYNYQGNFIKNLSQIGRPLSDSIIIDNSPASYIFHPLHSVPISSWFSDTHDNELLDLLPLLEDLSKQNVDDVSLVLDLAI